MQLLDTVEYVPWKTIGAALVYAGLGEKDEAFRSLDKLLIFAHLLSFSSK